MNKTRSIEKRVYPVLEKAIFERGIKKLVIADKLGVTPKTLSNKLAGERSFTWEEVVKLKTHFFPDIDTERLMSKSNEIGFGKE